MMRDRLIQLLTLLIALGAWLGATTLFPVINQQRLDEGLYIPPVIGQQTPPKYILITAMLGSFRGLAVDIMWYRAERLKNEGRFNEADTLARWITSFQPRFPHVWQFQAWNMAYNISVQTHTPQERWDWVHKGVRLLREEGIPNNPNATPIYRELSWIFFHKIGQRTDDMHWYYKKSLALEWQLLLGSQAELATTAQVIDAFKPIAQASDDFFVFNRLTRKARKLVDELAADDPQIADSLLEHADLNLVRVESALTKLEKKLGRDDPLRAKSLEPLRALVQEQTRRSATDRMTLFYQQHPDARPLVELLQRAGLELDGNTLKRIGRLLIFLHFSGTRFADEPTFLKWTHTNFNGIDKQILLQHESFERHLLPFLRAKVLVEEYHMDPGVMYELMELFGPLDFRHPATHGVYWAFLGARRAGELVDSTRIDLINTDRQVIHGLQELMVAGRISYDPRPWIDQIDLLPDPRFIESYFVALELTIKRMREAGDISQKQGSIEGFESGHENFLHRAISFTYLYGDTEQAQKHYDAVHKLYGGKQHNLRDNRYLLPLDAFVMRELQQDLDTQAVTRQFIDGMIIQGMIRGLAHSRPQVFDKFVGIAKAAHTRYQKAQTPTPEAMQDRMRILPFRQTLLSTYTATMSNPRLSLVRRSRIYANTPIWLRQITYPLFRNAIMQHARQQNINPDLAFPPPPGFEEGQIKALPKPDETPNTIQRQ
jgi:hypothetical protein